MGLGSFLARIFGRGGSRERVVPGAPIERFGRGASESQAVAFHHWIFLSGMVADDTNLDAGAQTEQALAKVDRALAQANSHKGKVLSATLYVADMGRRAEVEAAWQAWVDPENAPARTLIGMDLEGDALVTVAATARD